MLTLFLISKFRMESRLHSSFTSHRRMAMAKIIEFHIPAKFQKKVKWVPSEERGRLIEFPIVIKKSA